MVWSDEGSCKVSFKNNLKLFKMSNEVGQMEYCPLAKSSQYYREQLPNGSKVGRSLGSTCGCHYTEPCDCVQETGEKNKVRGPL